MAAPWEKYAAAAESAPPWEKYGNADGYNMNVTVGENESARQKFLGEEGSTGTKIREAVKPYVKAAMPYIRPALEMGLGIAGGVAGGVVGAPTVAGAPLGAAAGGAVGYATGKTAADTIERLANIRPDASIGQALTEPMQNIKEGAMFEAGGAAVGKAASMAAPYIRKAAIPLTKAWTERRAGQILADATPSTERTVANSEDARQLLARIGTDVTPTPAQMTGEVQAGRLEQSLMAKNPAAAAAVTENNAKMNQAALANLNTNLGADALPLSTPSASATGSKILTGISDMKSPVKEVEKAAWAKVPDYPMPVDATSQAIKELQQSPLLPEVKASVDAIASHIDQLPKTIKGMRVAEETIGNAISKAARSGDANLQRELYKIKNAVREDFTAMSDAASSGNIALTPTGSIVYPAKLQSQLAEVESRIAQTAEKAEPDIAAMTQALKDTGVHPAIFTQADRYDTGAPTRIIKAYKQKVSSEVPTIVNGGELAKLQADKSALENMISNLTPAEDAAKAINQARKISQRKFQRFGKGTTKDITAQGDEIGGTRVATSDIGSRYFADESSMYDLRRAFGAKEARQQMQPHIQQEMSKFVDNNGVMNVPQAVKWIRQNSNKMDVIGSTEDAVKILKEQLPQSMKRAIADKAKVDINNNPITTAREGLKLIKDFAPAMRMAYGKDGGKQLAALRDYQRTIALMGRNQNVAGSGSNTIDKLFGDAIPTTLAGRIFSEVVSTAGGAAAGGAISGAIGALPGAIAGNIAGKAYKGATEHTREVIRTLLSEAITDPAKAKILIDAAKQKTGKVNPELTALVSSTASKLTAMSIKENTNEENSP